MDTVLVVSYPKDEHAVCVLRKAKDLGIKAILWDISRFPLQSRISYFIYPQSETKSVLNIRGSELRDGGFKGIFWRRPQGVAPKKKNPGLKEYMRLESEVVIRSLYDFFPDANWLSSPEPARLACRKPVQLDIACSLGMRIPITCITNSPKEVRHFIGLLGDKQMTMKPVGTAFVGIARSGRVSSRENRVIFTKVVQKETILRNIDLVINCPVIFQEAINKDYDVRVTVVDKRVFAAAISNEGCTDPTNLDWRNYEGKRIYSPHNLPRDIEEKCVSIIRKLGIRFGCIDLAYSKKDGYTFFEVNPQGQWLPSELSLGYNISGAILEALIKR